MARKRIGVNPFRPQGFTGEGDKQLDKIHRKLVHEFTKIQKTLDQDDPLNLPKASYDQLSGLLVEFAEDIHNDIGIWRSYEQYNQEFFGAPLPLTVEPGAEMSEEEWFIARIHHLLWNVYPLFDPDLVISPTYQGFYQVAEQIAVSLVEQFSDVPQDSGVKKFFSEPVQWGWEVKQRLVWLGTQSYLFRYFFGEYVEEREEQISIKIIDDFICQETTRWSGLGALDMLAAVLDIPEEQRAELRSWYERHLAIYQVLSVRVKKGHMEVMNLINETPYLIRGGEEMRQFKKHMIVQGSLVPWKGEWYWSGGQTVIGGKPPKSLLNEMKQRYIMRMPQVVYRYCDDLAQKAQETLKEQYEEFVKYHGSDLVLYDNGATFAKDSKHQFRALQEAALRRLDPEIDLPYDHLDELDMASEWEDDMLELENGIAVYFNPDEGQEIMEEFNNVLSGFKKQGKDLTEAEADMIREFLFSDNISPAFVHRVVHEHGAESIAAAFFIDPVESEREMFLEYLLRKYKGHFYRRRFPSISFAPEPEA